MFLYNTEPAYIQIKRSGHIFIICNGSETLIVQFLTLNLTFLNLYKKTDVISEDL